MVRPPSPEYESMKGLRSSLNISDQSLVSCRHGPTDLPFVHIKILGDRAFIYHNEEQSMLHVVHFLEH